VIQAYKMAAKNKREEENTVSHVAFRIHNFWPQDPDTWLRQIECKFRVWLITSLQTKYNHTLIALPTEVCSNITYSLRNIDESEPNAYKQLKVLLVSRYKKARWTRCFEVLKYLELGDMKPTDLMRQMKALLPTDSSPCPPT
jgi:hypothetical protein